MPHRKVYAFFKRHILGLLVLVLTGSAYAWQADRILPIYDEWISLHIASGYGQYFDTATQFQLISIPLEKNPFTKQDYKQLNRSSNVTETIFRTENGLGLPHYQLLHQWMNYVGNSILMTRLLSGLLMFLAMIAWYVFLYESGGSYKWAALGIAVIGLNGFSITMAQTIRSYALGMLLIVLSTILVWRLAGKFQTVVKRPYFYGVLLGICWGSMLLTHFFTGFVFAGQLIFLLRQHVDIKALFPALLVCLATGVLWLLLGGYERIVFLIYIHQLAASENVSGFYQLEFWRIIRGYAGCLFAAVGFPSTGHSGDMMMNAVGALPALAILLLMKAQRNPLVRLCRYVILIQLAGSILYLAVAKFDIILNMRYWIFPLPFFIIALLSGLRQYFDATGWLRYLGVIVVCLLVVRTGRTVLNHFECFGPRPNDKGGRYQKAVTRVVGMQHAGDTLLFNNWETAQRINILLPESYPAIQLVDTAAPHDMVLLQQGRRLVLPLDPH